jgi:hypothetical protein
MKLLLIKSPTSQKTRRANNVDEELKEMSILIENDKEAHILKGKNNGSYKNVVSQKLPTADCNTSISKFMIWKKSNKIHHFNSYKLNLGEDVKRPPGDSQNESEEEL